MYNSYIAIASTELAMLVDLVMLYPAGTYLTLNGVVIANNSYVSASDVGEGESAVLCHTNNIHCCTGPFRAGEWYLPDGTRVGILGNRQNPDFFYRNRGEGVVRLNQVGNPTTRGHFYCEVPDTNGVIQTLHLYICEFIIIATPRYQLGN